MAEQRFLRIVNWDRFQHYRDRNPPWIKLYRDLLTSQTWVTLDDAGRVLAIACMMLAAATGNKIPFDPAYVRRVAYLNRDPDFSALLSLNFLEVFTEPASNSLAPCKRVASTEREAEAEAELESEKNPSLSSSEVFDLSLQKKKGFSQSDFDERDFRKLADARKKFDLMMGASVGCDHVWTEEQIILFECQQAGITPTRWHELERTRKSWSEGASA
jgi:hypothetical protein